jgi:hypothetical protein
LFTQKRNKQPAKGVIYMQKKLFKFRPFLRYIEQPPAEPVGGGITAKPNEPVTPPEGSKPATPPVPPEPSIEQKYQDARATALTDLEAKVAQLTADLAQRDAVALRGEVAKEAGLPADFVELLKGDTREELAAHAKTLQGHLKPADPFRAVTDGREGGAVGKQYTREEVVAMTPSQINEARVKGQLKNLGF